MLKDHLYCQKCSKLNQEFQFKLQSEFVKHVKEFHTRSFCSNENDVPVFICEFDSCFDLTNKFQSQIELINHIYMCHINLVSSLNWSISKCKIDLPALLNDPKSKQSDIFSKTWGDSFDKKEIPQNKSLDSVSISQLSSYLQKIRARQNAEKIKLSFDEFKKNSSESLEEVIPSFFHYFFANDFSLNNNEIFNKTIPIQKRTSKKDIIELRKEFDDQDKRLSSFLDHVELKIVQQVSVKSNAFFVAILGQSVAREQLKSTLDLLNDIRSNIQRGAHLSVNGVTELLAIAKRRSRFIKIRNKLKLISSVRGTQYTLQSLLNQRDYLTVWDILTSSISVLEGPLDNENEDLNSTSQELLNRKNRCIQNLSAVHHLYLQLKEYHKLVEALLDDDFEKQILKYNSFYTDHLVAVHDVNQQTLADSGHFKKCSEFIAYQIVPCINGYMRMNRYNWIHIIRMTGINFIKEIFQLSLKRLSEKSSNIHKTNGIIASNNDEGQLNNGDVSEMKMSSIISTLTKETWFSNLENLLRSIVNGLDHLHECLSVINKIVVDYYEKDDLSTTPVTLEQFQSTIDALSLEIKKLDKDFRQAAQIQLKNILITRYSGYLNRNPSSILDDQTLSPDNKTGRNPSKDEDLSGASNFEVMRIDFSEIVQLAQLLHPFQQLVYESWTEMGDLAMPNLNETFNPIMNQMPGPSPRGSPIELSLFINYFTNIFLKRVHEDKKTKMNLLLVKEQWVPCVVPDYIQKLANQLHDVTEELSMIDVESSNAQVLTRRIFSDFDSYLFKMDQESNSIRNYEQEKGSDSSYLQSREISKKEKCTGHLVFPSIHRQELPQDIWPILGNFMNSYNDVDSNQYILVNGVLLFLPIIIDYIKLVRRNLADLYKTEILPNFFKSRDEIGTNFTDIFTNIISTFNSRMVQLILGAEARKSVGNSISSRHLALAVRSMEFVLSIISRISILYQHGFGIPQLTSIQSQQIKNPFSIVERNIRSHIRDLYSKLLMVLTSRFEVRLNNWSPKPPIPTTEILETAKYMTKFTNAISDILSPKFTQALLICAHRQFKSRISMRIKQLEINPKNGPVYSLVEEDLGYYLSEFVNLLPILEGFEEKFAEIWT